MRRGVMNSRNTKYLGPFFMLLFAAPGSHPPVEAQATGVSAQQVSPPPRFAFGGNAAQIPADFVPTLILMPVRVDCSKAFFFRVDSPSGPYPSCPYRANQLGVM